jgi:oxygen-independent coproporphyrinogen III oxidase
LAGIYVHIPFCKKACHYCNFHFSTSLQLKNELIHALLKEVDLVKRNESEVVESIYFGGGTPSLMNPSDIDAIIEKIFSSFRVSNDAEITLEANPDDIERSKLESWKRSQINRLSIGIQSFREKDLLWMNRAHTASQALNSVNLAREAGFFNFSVDLIFGIPDFDNISWKKNVDQVIRLQAPHISAYALTVESRTALKKMIEFGKSKGIDPDAQATQYLLLMDWLEAAGYEHYEISSFALAGMRSRHNSSYWLGSTYIGLGPSAHSFDGSTRSWNVANNPLYIESIRKGIRPVEQERLTNVQQLNEYIMTSLRTSEGLDLEKIREGWGIKVSTKLESCAVPHEESMKIFRNKEKLQLTKQGKLFADGIAADLFQEEI